MLPKNCSIVIQGTFSALAVSGILLVSTLSTPSWGMYAEEENGNNNPLISTFSPQSLALMTRNESNNNGFTPPALDDLHKSFYLIHKTKIVPQEPVLYPAGINKPYVHNLEKPTCPLTVQWSAFSDLEWNNGDYNVAIIAPFANLQDRILIFSLAEIVTIGAYPLGPHVSILIPDDVPVTPTWNGPQEDLPHLIPYPHRQNISEAIHDYLKLKDFLQITKVPDTENSDEEFEWSEASGVINGGFSMSPSLFGKSFLDMCPYVSLGSEGDVKTGNWWRIAIANHYPFFVANSLKQAEQPYRFKTWFFEIYKRNNQKIIKKLKKHALPHFNFVQNRSTDIIEFLNNLADPEPNESTPSKKVFKLALFGLYGSEKGKAVYKALCDFNGETEELPADTHSKFLKVWGIVYPSLETSNIKNIIKLSNK